KEQRHVPEADEATQDEKDEGHLRIAHVVERRGVEDHADVEQQQQVGREHAEPVDVVPPHVAVRPHRGIHGTSFSRPPTMNWTTVSSATWSSIACGDGSQWRCTAQVTSVSRMTRAATAASGTERKSFN